MTLNYNERFAKFQHQLYNLTLYMWTLFLGFSFSSLHKVFDESEIPRFLRKCHNLGKYSISSTSRLWNFITFYVKNNNKNIYSKFKTWNICYFWNKQKQLKFRLWGIAVIRFWSKFIRPKSENVRSEISRASSRDKRYI